MTDKFSPFAKAIMEQKYAHEIDGEKETWEQVAHRVAHHVMHAVHAPKALVREVEQAIAQRKFMPGGRYLYATGRPFHQVQNCLMLRAEDSREGWADLMHKITMSLMTGAGIGVDYSEIRAKGKTIRKTGGQATGPTAVMQMVNEAGRGIMQGGSRRSAIWAGLRWNHPDCVEFVQMKNWSPEVRALKEKDFNFPATMDGTNISVLLDDDFFKAFHNEKNRDHALAQTVYWAVVRQMLKTAEPGFSVDVGVNAGETLRNACVTGDTEILTREGYQRIDSVVGRDVDVWNGFEWSIVTPKITGHEEPMLRVTLSDGRSLVCTHYHEWELAIGYTGRTERASARDLKCGDTLAKHEFPILAGGVSNLHAYTQGFVSADGMDGHSHVDVYEPKFPCVDRLSSRSVSKPYGVGTTVKVNVGLAFKTAPKSFVPFEWDVSSRLEWLAGLLDGDGTELKEGGAQIGSINFLFLQDVQKLLSTLGVQSKITDGNVAGYRPMPDGRGGKKDYFCNRSWRLLIGAVQMQQLTELGMRCSRLDFTGYTPQRDATQFVRVVSIENAGVAEDVYCFNEPKRHLGCFNGIVTGQCTELTSRDDSDICNLGSINMARIESLEEMERIVDLATKFLLAGTVYSDVPYPKVDSIRTKNRRLGLGLMGLHEWLLLKGKRYGADDDLAKYLDIYATSTDIARKQADEWEISRPKKTRAIAPTGTIGIVAETTTGTEPIFCVAYKRRYLKGNVTHYQYVVDPTAQRLIDNGVDPETIEDAYSLAENVERRVAFQVWLQGWVDHAISSTINLPAWGSEHNNEQGVRPFGKMLIKHLPKLRGITCYPDGARGGQPLTPVRHQTAVKHVGEVFVEGTDVCEITKSGSCGG